MRIDMHCHVKEGSLDSKVSLREYISLLMERGVGGMVITDHNTYNGYRYWEQQLKGKEFQDFLVLKGIEYDTFDGGHIIVIMPSHVNLQVLEQRGMQVEQLIELVTANGGILGPAHPCGEKYMSFFNSGAFKRKPEITNKFHFIETYNACEPESSNNQAQAYANRYNKPGIGGSDAHRPVCVGWGYVDIPGEIKSENDLIRLVKEEVSTTCGGKIYDQTTKDKLGRAKAVMAYSFLLYNFSGAIYKRRKRLKYWREEYVNKNLDDIKKTISDKVAACTEDKNSNF